MKIINCEYVKKVFSDNSCELLENDYINAKTKMKYKCSCGNISYITYDSFKKGTRCKKCSGKKIAASKKLSFDFILSEFKNQNCELLENNYKNAKTKMKYKCSCGNISYINYDSFKRGIRCRKCRGSSKRKFSYEYVKKIFESQDCELLSKEFINANNPLEYKCKCGTISKITFHSFKDNKSRCRNCYLARNSGQQHWKWISDREDAMLKKKFRKLCYQIVSNCFEKLDLLKNDKTYKLLGYHSNDLKNHITNHPNWINVKNTEWHIDHIYPIDAFMKYKIKDLSIINCLENLQPIKAKDNLKKSNKYNEEHFLVWLKSKFSINICNTIN